MKTALDILLESPAVSAREEKKFMIRRLVFGGEKLVCTVHGLGYSRIAELRKLFGSSDQFPLHLVLEGMSDPNLKDSTLRDKYGAATPAELVAKLFLPGEIDDICREIELLSGYRRDTLEDIKKK